jgi:MFS family permease
MVPDQCTLERTGCAAEHGQCRPVERTARTNSGFGAILRGRNFRLLWAGEAVSLLGDQFFQVALPWLVLQLTGDALAVGTVAAVGAAPRALFILLGGALTDRFSPRSVMLYSNVSRMVLVGVLALLTATGAIQLWMLYVFGLLLGLGYALYLPAQSAMIPRLVGADRLQTGNAIIQGTSQLSLFIGPVAAGVFIAFFGGGQAATTTVADATGIAVVFALDAASFLASAITLGMIRLPAVSRNRENGRRKGGVFSSLADGIATVWRDKPLRYYLLLIGAVNLFLIGPISVGVPILARTRFSGGAVAFGIILSALGAGALIGVIAAGTLRRPAGRGFAVAMLGFSALLGVGLALLGVVPSLGAAIAAAFLAGLAEGYLTVEFITWLQLRTSPEELGRTLSILLFAAVGLAPLSNAVAGVLMRENVSLVMAGAGALIVLVTLIAALSPSVWQLGDPGQPGGVDTSAEC